MQSQIVILSGGRENHLLQIRNEVLRISGYTVVSAYSPLELVQKFRAGDFDVVLLCHSFMPEEVGAIEHAIHAQSPSTPVLVMAVENAIKGSAEHSVSTDPSSLLNAVSCAIQERFSFRPREQAS